MTEQDDSYLERPSLITKTSGDADSKDDKEQRGSIPEDGNDEIEPTKLPDDDIDDGGVLCI